MAEETKRGRGRPLGSKSKHTKERLEAVAEAAQVIETMIGPNAFKGDAHTLLMTVYKDTSRDIELRIEAAKAAIGYEKPKLASTQVQATITRSHEDLLDDLEAVSDDEVLVARH